MIKLLIVDDHAVVRTGVREFLAATDGLEVLGEAATGEEALAMVREKSVNIVLLDVSLPDLNGMEVLKRIKHERPELPVLIFSMYPEEEFALQAFDGGASGYLSKMSPAAEIRAAIQTVFNGARYVSPSLAESLLNGSVHPARRLLHENLSRREMQVLLLLSNGISLTKIGELLNLSVKTVGTYRARMLEKLNVSSNAELTRYVLQHKLG
jgi:DNA-binding NarL/FixJ family response regulator